MITSLRLHDERGRQSKSDRTFSERDSLLKCILTVFLAYARAAIEIGERGVWSVDRVRTEAFEGLRLITIAVSSKRNYDYFIESGGGYIRYQTQREFEATAEWRDFEDEILALAARDGAGDGDVRSPVGKAGTSDRVATENSRPQESTPTDLVSWDGLRAAFQECAAEYDSLSAECDSLYKGGWILGDGSPRSHRRFKDLAGAAVAKLGPVNIEPSEEPWQVWLGQMWAKGWRRPELPLPDASISLRGRLPWRVARTKLEQAARTIWRVFQTSADCCRDLKELEESDVPHRPGSDDSQRSGNSRTPETLEPEQSTEAGEQAVSTLPEAGAQVAASERTVSSNETPSDDKRDLSSDAEEGDPPPSEPKTVETVTSAKATPVQTISPGSVESGQSFGSFAVFTDPRYPPPDIWQEAYLLIKEALKAWRFKGGEPENVFWNQWLDQYNWHGETNFLRASIEHCKVFANHLLGEGRNEDAGALARVAVGLEILRAKADVRVEDLIAKQLNLEIPDKSNVTNSTPPLTGTPEEQLAQFIAAHPGATYADIKYSAKVHTAEFQDWRRGELKPTSIMAERIEAVLSGQTVLQKRPKKIGPD